MEYEHRPPNLLVFVDPDALARFSTARSLWHEEPEEIEAGLEWGRQKAELLRWVRRTMRRRLTPQERRCMELYFFQNRSCREVAAIIAMTNSSTHRMIQRCLKKLRAAAQRRRRRPQR